MPNKKIYCSTCGKSFVFSIGEQRYYKFHHLQEPRKCKSCKKEEANPYNMDFLVQKLGYTKIGIRYGKNGYFNSFTTND